jgi:carboxynorspermidine decarboxylase
MTYPFSKIPSPCYTLVEEKLIDNLKLLNSVQQQTGVSIICALKGFSMWSVFHLVKQYLSGATASSLNEALLIHEEMKDDVHAYCPTYIPNEFHKIVQLSKHLTFNSMSEYDRYIVKAKSLKPDISCGIRINPEYSEITTDIYNPAIKNSRLGVTHSELGETLPQGVDGLHFHLLCEQDSYVLERVLHKTEEQFAHLFTQCKWINLGGGHLITRKGYDVAHLISVLKKLKQRYPNAEIIMEPGEAVGWETGYLVSTVLDMMEKESLHIAMLDVSFAAHMPDTLEMPYKPRIIGANEPIDGRKTYRLGGTTCLAGDFMGDYSFDKDLKVGDNVVFEDMIHYTMVKTTFFNGVKHPNIGKIDEKGDFHLIRTFEYADFKKKLS